jgi:DNA polymerase III delta prime subunit
MFIIVGQYTKNDKDFVIERLGDKSEIVIDQIHEMQKIISLAHQPLNVVIREAQFLNPPAQNALLKTLEEPPENTTIYLYVDSEDNLLPTIVSRCVVKVQSLKFKVEISSDLIKLLNLILETNIKEGFKWAEKIKDRQEAVKIIDDLMATKESLSVYRRLQKTKKYLRANCNLRLTLENLFIDTL